MFSYFSACAAAKGNRVLILAHREELLQQISDTLENFQVTHSFIAASRPYLPEPKVHVGSVFTVSRRLGKFPAPQVIIIDEAHHARAETWGKVLQAFPHAKVVGVTASPIRLSGEALGDVFDDLVLGPSIKTLTEEGNLCPYRIFAPPGIDPAQLKTFMGEFSKKSLAAAADRPHITGNAILEYAKHAAGKRAIVFCTTVKHAENVAIGFVAEGFSACSLDGKMPREKRQCIVEAFRAGDIKVLTSCEIVSEGFDLPAIEVAIMLRPTQSLGLWIQQSGRALRPFTGKKYALILDHAGNVQRHGLPDQDRKWTLDGKDKQPSEGVWICQVCFAANSTEEEECQNCGEPRPFRAGGRKPVEEVPGELEELDKESWGQGKSRLQEQGDCKTIEALIALGKRRGYKSPVRWAKHLIAARGRKYS